ncbi:hypothetical protein [Caviibacterium pharyngocola]|uniref:Uncharacterized protein n=1 Tax=Caviibacterium pharyngocola TaxID=28159 RepID=A0A2M8RTK7_9PAST|nr:hypothetical protein [Caviibacterium pharyngocola]PJG82222.1 hypothetical protein CVP04_10185 [Caviibacterium pharyngocola]
METEIRRYISKLTEVNIIINAIIQIPVNDIKIYETSNNEKLNELSKTNETLLKVMEELGTAHGKFISKFLQLIKHN